jgi:preprotein translocase subunit SecF
LPEDSSNAGRNAEGRKEKPDVNFHEVEEFLEEKEKSIKKDEEKAEKEIEKEEEKIDMLEGKKDEIEKRKEEVDEKLRKERQRAEELKKEEASLENAEEHAEQLKEDIEEKRIGIKESVEKIREIFKREKKVAEKGTSQHIIREIYENKYKLLLAIPFLMFLLAVVQISHQYNTTGDFVNRGVELKGGITLTIPEKTYDAGELSQILNEEIAGDISVRSISGTKGLLIEASDVSEDELLEKVEEKLGELDPDRDYSIEEMGSSLGASFFREITKSIIIAFILMAVVVFITFRIPAPSLAVILAALSDIIVTLAVFNLTGIKLGKGGIAAFLMLIGYSVDTDILLSTKVLKRKFGTVMDRVYSAMKTGLTMNLTTIVAITIAMAFTQSEVIRQIMTILLIGLFVDIINTWIQNVGILRLYLERKGKAK